MKKYVLGLCLLIPSLTAVCQEQKPVYDTVTNNIRKFRTEYKDPYAQATVSIQAGSESGQGLVIGSNLVLTSYSLVAGKSDLSYKDASGRTKYFDGYIAADPVRGIIILKTEAVHTQLVQMSSTSYNTSLSLYKQKVSIWHKDGNRFIVDTAILPRNEEIKGNYKVYGYLPRKVDYAGPGPIQGYIDFDESNLFVGMIVYKDGHPYHINNRPMLELSLFGDLAPLNIADLPTSFSVGGNQKSKPSIYKIDLFSETKGFNNSKTVFDRITLDYAKRDQQNLSFYFTVRAFEYTSGFEFTPNLRMVDLRTGIVYTPSSYDNAPSYVYNNTSNRAAIHFQNIPASVSHVKLFNLPVDVYDYYKELQSRYSFTAKKFFDNVIISNFPVTKKPHYDLEEDFTNEGTVSFYCLESSNMTDNVRISIDGDVAGTLTKYYTDRSITDFCGRSSTVTVKLKPGEYKYKAVMGGKSIERKFMITKGKCLGQLIKF